MKTSYCFLPAYHNFELEPVHFDAASKIESYDFVHFNFLNLIFLLIGEILYEVKRRHVVRMREGGSLGRVAE